MCLHTVFRVWCITSNWEILSQLYKPSNCDCEQVMERVRIWRVFSRTESRSAAEHHLGKKSSSGKSLNLAKVKTPGFSKPKPIVTLWYVATFGWLNALQTLVDPLEHYRVRHIDIHAVCGGKGKSKRRVKSAWGEIEEPLRREPGGGGGYSHKFRIGVCPEGS